MRKRSIVSKYDYGSVTESTTQRFKEDVYKRIGLKRLFSKKKILDLGCGHGTDSIILARFAKEIIGVDIQKYKEWKIFERENIKYIKVNSAKLPFKDNAFDGVYLKDLLHHIKGNVEITLDEIRRVTKPSGNIVILEGNRYNPVFYLYATTLRGHDHFSQREFKDLINKKLPRARFIFLEAYPPFRFPEKIYKYIIRLERHINKLAFLKPFFSYNIAIIENEKKPGKKRKIGYK